MIKKGKCAFEPTKFMQEEFAKSIKKISEGYGFHMTHIFHRDVYSGEMCARKAYFEGYGDAELFAYEYDQKNYGNKKSYAIYIDKELYVTRLFGNDTDIFKESTTDADKCICTPQDALIGFTAAIK